MSLFRLCMRQLRIHWQSILIKVQSSDERARISWIWKRHLGNACLHSLSSASLPRCPSGLSIWLKWSEDGRFEFQLDTTFSYHGIIFISFGTISTFTAYDSSFEVIYLCVPYKLCIAYLSTRRWSLVTDGRDRSQPLARYEQLWGSSAVVGRGGSVRIMWDHVMSCDIMWGACDAM